MNYNEHRIKMTDFILPLLFLYAVDFLDLSGILLSFCLLMTLLFLAKEVKLDSSARVLIIFSVFYFISVFYYEGSSLDVFIKYAVAPWGCYIIGYTLGRIKNQLTVTKLSYVLVGGFFIHGLFNIASAIKVYGINFNSNFRLAYDFWQQRTISVTTVALYYSPMALMGMGMLFFGRKAKERVLAAFAIFVGVFATLLFQNRTLIMAMVIVAIIGMTLTLVDKYITKKKKITICVIVALIALFAGIVWIADIGGVRSFIEGTAYFSRVTGEGQDRTKIWKSFVFGDAWKYPFGGNKAVLYKNRTFVHNVWLDIYRRAGIIPFLTFVAFTVMAIETAVSFLRTHDNSENPQVIVILLVGFVALFFVEPVIEANPYAFYLPLIIVGNMSSKMAFQKIYGV